MQRLLYLSTLCQNSQTGGANAVNYHTYEQLQRYFECTYVQINPPESKWGRWWSQFLRKVLGLPGRFNYFSTSRLRRIAQVYAGIPGEYDYIFFRGFTPWVLCQPKAPYFAYNDVHFRQFFVNTFSDREFKKKDIDRICRQEQEWLARAQTVFFESAWGMDQFRVDYGLRSDALKEVGRGGNIPIPIKDTYQGKRNLLVVANNFYQKGGDLVFAAFKELQSSCPTLQLHIVGGHPGEEVIQTRGVVYHGYLYKERVSDLKKLVYLFSQAFLLIHVTREDTNPLVITEAGYFGCPCISVDHFAIAELIRPDDTGVLLPYLPEVSLIIESIERLILEEKRYQAMRRAAWAFNHSTYQWDIIGEKMSTAIKAIES